MTTLLSFIVEFEVCEMLLIPPSYFLVVVVSIYVPISVSI